MHAGLHTCMHAHSLTHHTHTHSKRISPFPSLRFFKKGLSFFSYKMAPSVCL